MLPGDGSACFTVEDAGACDRILDEEVAQQTHEDAATAAAPARMRTCSRQIDLGTFPDVIHVVVLGCEDLPASLAPVPPGSRTFGRAEWRRCEVQTLDSCAAGESLEVAWPLFSTTYLAGQPTNQDPEDDREFLVRVEVRDEHVRVRAAQLAGDASCGR